MAVQVNGAGPLPEVPRIADSVKEQIAEKNDLSNKLNAVLGGEREEEAETTEEQSAADPAEQSAVETPAEEQPGEEAATTEEAASETTEEQPTEAAATQAPTLPAAYRRSLKAYDWTDEEIDAAAKQPGFLATAAKIHTNRVKETAAWSEAGRKAKEAAQPKPTQDAPQQQPQQIALKPIDAAALKAEYGDDALIDKLVGPVNATIEKINSILPIVQQTQQRAAMSEADTLGRQIDGFFGGKEMESYSKLYGANGKLTQEHYAARNKVLEFADTLIGGAALQGRSLGFDEAMQLAHDAVSGGVKEQAAREKITTQVKARNKGISLKPGARGTNLNKGPVKTRSDLEKRVNQGLRAVLG